MLVTGCGRPAADTAGKSASARMYSDVHQLPESIAPDGTTIRVGSPRAKTVVRLFEDMRCPVCKEFETGGGGEALRELTLSGAVRVEYTLATFLDGRLSGQGSEKAANALRAALDAGKFTEYHEVLFAHQPEETTDGYTDAFLLRMASKVKGLRSEKFDAAVKGMKYRDYATASQKAYQSSGAPGTPTMKVNGRIVGQGQFSSLFDKDTLPQVILLTAHS
ncbi:DSBA oxidoreductase [Streptomyces sp. MUSC 125]|nr:DSBA oxidoreductase [Streptomyces sp. MUSC 125]